MRFANLNVQDAVRELTMEVTLTGVKRFQFRLWLAKPLLRLAAKIIGCKIDIKNEKTE
jgi:hypothetical protein